MSVNLLHSSCVWILPHRYSDTTCCEKFGILMPSCFMSLLFCFNLVLSYFSELLWLTRCLCKTCGLLIYGVFVTAVILMTKVGSTTRESSGSLMHVVDFLLRQPDEKLGNAGKTRGRRRKRGKWSGVKLRLRKQRLARTPLPLVILGNVQSLRNKLDELQGYVRLQKDYENCGVLAFTETWLNEQDLDMDLCIDDFGRPFHLDRNAEVTGKKQGGGGYVCMSMNNITVLWRCDNELARRMLNFWPFHCLLFICLESSHKFSWL